MAGGVTKLLLKYVHEYRDRHGKLRRYFRRGGRKTVLSGLPGSDEFMAAYQAALAGIAITPPIGASRTQPGTVNAAVVGYYQSLAFRSLAARTQSERRIVLERFRSEHGDKHVRTLPQKFIVKMLSHKRPAAARNWLTALRGLLQFAAAEGFRPDNPALGIKLPKYRGKSRHPWTPEEVERFEAHWPVGTKQRLAFALGLYTAQRRGDVLRMGPQHVRDGAIHIRQSKTGTELALDIDPILKAVMDATSCEHLTFVTTQTGRPFGGNDFSDQFRKWCDAAGLPKDCTFHGLRHTFGYRAAEAGATTHEIAAMTGHKSLSEVQRYTRGADQLRLARRTISLMTKQRTR